MTQADDHDMPEKDDVFEMHGVVGRDASEESDPEIDVAVERARANRDELGAILEELTIRRRELADWRLQARRHRGLLVGLATVVVGVVVLTVWNRRRTRPTSTIRRWRRRLARAIAGDRNGVAPRDESVKQAASSAAASGLVRLLGRALTAPFAATR